MVGAKLKNIQNIMTYYMNMNLYMEIKMEMEENI